VGRKVYIQARKVRYESIELGSAEIGVMREAQMPNLTMMASVKREIGPGLDGLQAEGGARHTVRDTTSE
jgi:hypothetical protein